MSNINLSKLSTKIQNCKSSIDNLENLLLQNQIRIDSVLEKIKNEENYLKSLQESHTILNSELDKEQSILNALTDLHQESPLSPLSQNSFTTMQIASLCPNTLGKFNF